MPLPEPILPLLACARCDRSLETGDEGELHCPACRVEFPVLDGVPCLFAEPKHTLAEWRERMNFALEKLARDERAAAKALDADDLPESTRRRLELQIAAYRAHADELRALLAPMKLDGMRASYESYIALRTRLPSDQGLTTYYSNVHRDWCWGDEENRESLNQVLAALGDAPPGNTLVLGAGAGRLAYDLHMALDHPLTVALDFNPLLVLAAARVAAGEPVPLHEFPIAPRTLEHTAIARELRAPAPVRDGYLPVLASALRPPFQASSFDTVLTPWLVDILPEDLPTQAARWNGLLRPGGRWICFGSLAFRSESPAECYSFEEVQEIVAGAGFGEPLVTEAEIPYMASPASRHARRERVVTMVAEKTAEAPKPKRHVALPDWIVTGKKPVPALENFRMQAMSTRIHAFIMSMIDGKRSIRDMAALLEEQRLMTREEGESAVRGFLIKMLEESQRYPTL